MALLELLRAREDRNFTNGILPSAPMDQRCGLMGYQGELRLELWQEDEDDGVWLCWLLSPILNHFSFSLPSSTQHPPLSAGLEIR